MKHIIKKATETAYNNLENCVSPLGSVKENVHDLQMYINASEYGGSEVSKKEAQILINKCEVLLNDIEDDLNCAADWVKAINEM